MKVSPRWCLLLSVALMTVALVAGAQPDAGSPKDGGAAAVGPDQERAQPPRKRPQKPPHRQGRKPRQAGSELTVYLLTFGPGDHPFFKFGHNAIRIRDRRRGTDWCYNYGTFNFGSPALIPKFVLGRFHYWVARRPMKHTLLAYRAENRSITAQRLNLTPAERLELQQFLEWNIKPENKRYKYDYYRDNCSTRVRDAIDKVIGGRIQLAAAKPGRMTYRAHSLRLTQDLFLEYVGLLVSMGALIDQPTTEWEETFLPGRLQEVMRQVTVPGPEGDEPLVLEEQVLLTADRPPPAAEPPSWFFQFLLAGLLFGGGLAALGRFGQRRRYLRIGAGVTLLLMGLLLGFLGTFFVFVWAITDHEVGYANENILQCAPWLLALTSYGVGVARGRRRATRKAFLVTATAAGAAALGVVLKVLPWFDQYNWQIIAFTVPTLGGATLCTRWLHQAAVLLTPADGPGKPAAAGGDASEGEPAAAEPAEQEPAAKAKVSTKKKKKKKSTAGKKKSQRQDRS